MSNTNKGIIGAIIAIVVIGGGYFAWANQSKIKEGYNKAEYQEGYENEEQESAGSGKKIAFSELVKQNGTYKCEVKQYMSDFENEGTVYMSGGSLAGEFSTVAEGRIMKSNFLMKDGYIYNWSSELANVGIKIKMDKMASAEAGGAYSWNPEQIGDYDCEAWTTDQSKFELPKGVTFTEFNS